MRAVYHHVEVGAERVHTPSYLYTIYVAINALN